MLMKQSDKYLLSDCHYALKNNINWQLGTYLERFKGNSLRTDAANTFTRR